MKTIKERKVCTYRTRDAAQCFTCKQELPVRRHSRMRFCCKKCQMKFNNAKQLVHFKECAQCNKAFLGKPTQLFCKHICWREQFAAKKVFPLKAKRP